MGLYMWLVIDIRALLDTALPFTVFTQKPLVTKEGYYHAAGTASVRGLPGAARII